MKILALSFCIAVVIVGISTTIAIVYTPKPVGGTVYLNIDNPDTLTKPKYRGEVVTTKGQKRLVRIDNNGK